ncbi:MAG: ABC transporter permease subunit [Alphaproteobacteria bacterium]|jgi:NitT/TauT family transport system permease protein|nr:ABC transporter permease subunit [Alphaproteobacteria bacterium]
MTTTESYSAPGALAGRMIQRLQATRTRGRRRRQLPRDRVWPPGAVPAVQIGIFVAVLALWELGARTGFVDSFFWSQPTKIWQSLTIFIVDGEALVDTWYTFHATVLGFVLGTSMGAVIGLSFWWSRNYSAVVQPYLVCFEAMPKLALAPLVVLVFGMGLASKVALGVAITLVVTTLTCYAGVKAVDRDQERLLYSLGASRLQVFRKLVIPSVLPWIISVLRVNIGLALTGTIVGEFISSQHGLGRLILYAGETYDIALIWVGVLVLSILSVVMYVVVGAVEKTLIKGVTHGTADAA